MRKLFTLLCFSALNSLCADSVTEGIPEEICDMAPVRRGTIRHIDPGGVGYKQGYTSADLFLAQVFSEKWVPFIDFRAHIFNNGKPAANLGLGFRYLASDYIFGLNSYYDYRKTPHTSYNQFSLGLEALGETLDFRVSGYLPLGKQKSKWYSPSFEGFSGNRVLITQRREFAMPGVSAEVGGTVDWGHHLSSYFAAGPYYFSRSGKNAVGGEIRASITFFDRLKIEGFGSYDPVFKGIGQGEVSLIFPFGPKSHVRKSPNRQCHEQQRFQKRAFQPVFRNEIIVVSTERQTTEAINPLTQTPYEFVFIDNTSHSAGTFESPYPSLQEAEINSTAGNFLYVFPGVGTTGMNTGIALKERQTLLGSGTAYPLETTVGQIILPAQTHQMPTITNTDTLEAVVTLNDNCEVYGMHIVAPNIGILGGSSDPTSLATGVTNTTIQRNVIDGSYQTGILLNNCPGLLEVHNNLFHGQDQLYSSVLNINFVYVTNALDTIEATLHASRNAMYIEVPTTLTGTFNGFDVEIHNPYTQEIRENTIQGSGTAQSDLGNSIIGMFINPQSLSASCHQLLSNSFDNIFLPINFATEDSSIAQVTISANHVINTPVLTKSNVELSNLDLSSICTSISGNLIENTFLFDDTVQVNTLKIDTFLNNVGTISPDSTSYELIPLDSCECTTVHP